MREDQRFYASCEIPFSYYTNQFVFKELKRVIHSDVANLITAIIVSFYLINTV